MLNVFHHHLTCCFSPNQPCEKVQSLSSQMTERPGKLKALALNHRAHERALVSPGTTSRSVVSSRPRLGPFLLGPLIWHRSGMSQALANVLWMLCITRGNGWGCGSLRQLCASLCPPLSLHLHQYTCCPCPGPRQEGESDSTCLSNPISAAPQHVLQLHPLEGWPPNQTPDSPALIPSLSPDPRPGTLDL